MTIPINITLLAIEATSNHNDGWNKEVFRKRLREIKIHCTGDKQVKEYIEGVLAKN